MPHYYDKNQNSPLNLKKINIKLKNLSFELLSASGVFSKDKLDKGTELLINDCIIEDGWRVLDIGCGIGVVGIALKKMYSKLKVTMVDINSRAVKLSEQNLQMHGIKDANALQSDLFEKIENEKFDTILTNPPQSAGKKVCFKIIEESKEHLNKNGLLQLVARHNKGGKDLRKKMHEVFGNAIDIAKKGGYRVYVSKYMGQVK